MEKSKLTTKILFAVAFAICALNLALMILFLPPGNKVLYILGMAILQPVMLALLAVVAKKPDINRKYSIKTVEGKLKLKKKKFPPKPTPSHMVMCGLTAVMVSLVITMTVWLQNMHDSVLQKYLFIINVVLIAATAALIIYFNRKAEKEFTEEK